MRNMRGVGLLGNMHLELGTKTVCKAYLLFSGIMLRPESGDQYLLNTHKYQFFRILLLLTRDQITKQISGKVCSFHLANCQKIDLCTVWDRAFLFAFTQHSSLCCRSDDVSKLVEVSQKCRQCTPFGHCAISRRLYNKFHNHMCKNIIQLQPILIWY